MNRLRLRRVFRFAARYAGPSHAHLCVVLALFSLSLCLCVSASLCYPLGLHRKYTGTPSNTITSPGQVVAL
jgi:hypothetical protein